MAFYSIFEFEEGMDIVLEREANREVDVVENIKTLGNEDIEVLKFVYEHELVTTKFIDVFTKKNDRGLFESYSIANRLKIYLAKELLDSYYVKSPDGERSSNMYMLTDKASAYIKERYELVENSNELHDFIKVNDVLNLQKRMALNQFLICAVDVKDYKIVTGEKYNAVIEYNDEPNKYYIRVVRYDDEDIASVRDSISYIDEELTGDRAIILLCEYPDLIVDVTKTLEDMDIKTELFFTIDIYALEFPEWFQRIDAKGDLYIVTDVTKVKKQKSTNIA